MTLACVHSKVAFGYFYADRGNSCGKKGGYNGIELSGVVKVVTGKAKFRAETSGYKDVELSGCCEKVGDGVLCSGGFKLEGGLVCNAGENSSG